MTIPRARRAVAVALLLGLLATPTPVGATDTTTTTTTTVETTTTTTTTVPEIPCSTHVVVGAPGSGEVASSTQASRTHGLGVTVDHLYSALAADPRLAHPEALSLSASLGGAPPAYAAPAVPGPGAGSAAWALYVGDVLSAGPTVLAALGRVATACPTSRLLLVGYSQGAAVLHEALAMMAQHPSSIVASGLTGRALAGHLAGVVLVADPYAQPTDRHLLGRGGAATWNVTGPQAYGVIPLEAALADVGTIPGIGPSALRDLASALAALTRTLALGCRSLPLVGRVGPTCGAQTTVARGLGTLRALAALVRSGPGRSDLRTAVARGYFLSARTLGARLRVPVYSATAAGDLVAEPLGATSLTSTRFSAAVHTSAYRADPVLARSVVAAVG